MTNEELYKAMITDAALRIAGDLKTISNYASKAFYTDDDDDLDPHTVSDSGWYHHNYPFKDKGIDALHKQVLAWARHLDKDSMGRHSYVDTCDGCLETRPVLLQANGDQWCTVCKPTTSPEGGK